MAPRRKESGQGNIEVNTKSWQMEPSTTCDHEGVEDAFRLTTRLLPIIREQGSLTCLGVLLKQRQWLTVKFRF